MAAEANATLRDPRTLAAYQDIDSGPLFLTGLQALVRLLLLQSHRDSCAGLRTAGYVSGYRGSPLGGLDLELWRAGDALRRANIHFEPGLNEELAATSVWGSQQAGLFGDARFDGVFGLWYGKGPGVDRSGDAFKHANAAGTAANGGVLVAAGDDHACKSSTLPQQSEYSFIDAMMPVLNPADVRELIELGLAGFAMSRFSGCWVGFKVIQETADASQTVMPEELAPRFVSPQHALPGDGLNIRWPDSPLAQEQRLHYRKLAAAVAFAKANRLNRVVVQTSRPRLGIAATGKSFRDVMEALKILGLDEARAADLGLRVYKIGMSWPLEPDGLREFANGLDEILVVEEKRGVIESQIKELLYGSPAGLMPLVVGKANERGEPMLPSVGELGPGRISRVIGERLARLTDDDELVKRLAALETQAAATAGLISGNVSRLPHFCSGCPHNTSTRVPEGSRAIAGIGCHFMATWMGRNTSTFTQMGAEGATWIGQAPFVETGHVFQNLGDGTYTHSGSLAIRAAVAAGVNITYKILYNDAVAMTGGQPVEGAFSPARIAQQLLAEGVGRVVIVTDHPVKYADQADLPSAVPVYPREDLDRVQRELREHSGVSALIYDQTCAAELRRRRKRRLLPEPHERVVINELVCEGCGDCVEKSNCLAVQPLETELGRKRTIDQSACNRDLSCLNGFCPSFVTVTNARQREHRFGGLAAPPEPKAASSRSAQNILVAGIGGTGVVTASRLIALAAHLEGKAVRELDQTGLAQKFGAVLSHIRVAADSCELHSSRIPENAADLLLGCDLMVAAGESSLTRLSALHSTIVLNTHEELPPNYIHEPDVEFPSQSLLATLQSACRADSLYAVDATGIARRILGDALAANIVIVGIALQRGLLPVSAAALDRALELFGVDLEKNRRALLLGRQLVADDSMASCAARDREANRKRLERLEDIVAYRVEYLRSYQDSAYAERYKGLVERIGAKESEVAPGSERLAISVARNYFKLLAYKDEYEVARLFTETGFLDRLRREFDGDFKLKFHLAPPMLAKMDSALALPRKRAFGQWILPFFRVLARLRVLRGGPLDVFRFTRERRAERRLIVDYERLLERILREVDEPRLGLAIDLASLPDGIRGFGPIKSRAATRAAARQAELLEAWSASA
jgi:indolepyruvate ferredoxin oxidoreductase